MGTIWQPGSTDTVELLRALAALLGRYADPRLTADYLAETDRAEAWQAHGVAALQSVSDPDDHLIVFVTPDGFSVSIEINLAHLDRAAIDRMLADLHGDLDARRAERARGARPAAIVERAVKEHVH